MPGSGKAIKEEEVICKKTLIFLFLKHILGLKRSFVFCFILQYSIAL